MLIVFFEIILSKQPILSIVRPHEQEEKPKAGKESRGHS